jgi:hypothetical protein
MEPHWSLTSVGARNGRQGEDLSIAVREVKFRNRCKTS